MSATVILAGALLVCTLALLVIALRAPSDVELEPEPRARALRALDATGDDVAAHVFTSSGAEDSGAGDAVPTVRQPTGPPA